MCSTAHGMVQLDELYFGPNSSSSPSKPSRSVSSSPTSTRPPRSRASSADESASSGDSSAEAGDGEQREPAGDRADEDRYQDGREVPRSSGDF